MTLTQALTEHLAFDANRINAEKMIKLSLDDRHLAIQFAREEHARTAPLMSLMVDAVAALETARDEMNLAAVRFDSETREGAFYASQLRDGVAEARDIIARIRKALEAP